MQRLMSGAAQMGLNLSASHVAAFDLYTDELLARLQRRLTSLAGGRRS